jgi:ATP-dependent protease HslVU (ClpYQ) peptidase subunit
VLEEYAGTAADAFTQFHDRWQRTARDHLRSMKTYREYVATARDNYADARCKNLEMFG